MMIEARHEHRGPLPFTIGHYAVQMSQWTVTVIHKGLSWPVLALSTIVDCKWWYSMFLKRHRKGTVNLRMGEILALTAREPRQTTTTDSDQSVSPLPLTESLQIGLISNLSDVPQPIRPLTQCIAAGCIMAKPLISSYQQPKALAKTPS